jgi:hypothetical protein
MSVAIQRNDCPGFYGMPSGAGFSDASRNLISNLGVYIRSFFESETMGRSMEEAEQALVDIYSECSESDWDGYGALPLSRDSVYEAFKFIELLPSSFPMPHIIAEPSGEVGLEWPMDEGLIFAISFSGNNMITYAGIFGSNKTHGTEYFGDTIPSVIIENLKRLS